MPVPQRVLNWLYSILTGEYQDINRSYYDISQVLATYPNLNLQNEVHTFSNGASALMLNIYGTIPVVFRGHTYYFPISVWVPHAYPREPPIVYVTPTPKMVVRPGQYVDPQGQVYHPYLSGWPTFWDKSTIVDLLAILIDVFAKEPPLTARPANASTPVSTGSPAPPQPTPAQPPAQQPAVEISGQPVPVPARLPVQASVMHAPQSSAAPAPPPKQPHGSQAVAASPYTQSPPPSGASMSRYASPAPLPGAQPVRSPTQSPPIKSSRYESAPPLPPAVQRYQQPQQQHIQVTHQHMQVGQTPPSYARPLPPQMTGSHPQNPQQPPQQSPFPQQSQYSSPPAQPEPPKPKTPLPDLMDEPATFTPPPATPVAAPPISRNPEKDQLCSQLAAALHSERMKAMERYDTSIQGLYKQREAMTSATQGMQAEIADLAQFSHTTATNIAILHETLAHADKVIADSKTHPQVNIDELLVAPTVVGNQLYTVVAEERALNDAIFVLGRALERGRISPAVFAKTTRGLARDLFMRRALAHKIAKGMGLNM
ncbi:hypothetical protein TD95_003704 [Thielaviopsis punctulata]|uniref:UEV domain-containing protein n=1 Tax=Thielaviopsis punctulata TaxID=72032 RepID=A0A0F4ZCP5_9PEZI|nr:hypothetical protein TD95_003704 [Thielaviopsis punctulata]